MRVKDIMTPAVISVVETAPLWEALELMVSRRVSALAVHDDAGTPIGVLSEGDLMRRAELGTQKRRPGWLEFLLGSGRTAQDYVHSHGRRVGELMTRGVISIGEDADISEGVDLMLQRNIKRLVVVQDGHAIGVLSRSDILKALLARFPTRDTVHSDAEISEAVSAEIAREDWVPHGTVRIRVSEGEVTLEGAINDERLRGALRVLVENIPGVKNVHDRLAWIEPNSGYLVPASND